MLSPQSIIVASKEPVFSELGDEVVIFSPRNGEYYGLNAVGARVWSLIQEPIVVEQVRDSILVEFNTVPEDCERDLLELLQSLLEQNLVEIAG